jgi:hypothetical protein
VVEDFLGISPCFFKLRYLAVNFYVVADIPTIQMEIYDAFLLPARKIRK